MVMTGVMELLVLLLFGVVLVPTPIGVPPLAENPALLRAAPATSVFFFEWFGSDVAQGGAGRNATERLAAEPEIRGFVAALHRAARAAWSKEASGMNLSRTDAERLFDTLTRVLLRPGCISVFDVDAARGQFGIALCADLGDAQDATAEASAAMRTLGAMFGDDTNGSRRAFDGVTIEALHRDGASWAIVDDYLVVGFGDEAVEQVIRGLRQHAGHQAIHDNPRFRAAQTQAAVARPATRSFIDLEALFASLGAGGGREMALVTQAMGLGRLRSWVSESGLEGEGFVQRTSIATEGMLEALKLFAGRALTPDDFALVPDDALFAIGARLSARDALREAFAQIDRLMPGAGEQARRELFGDLDRVLGVDVEADVLAHLGDSWTIWSSPRRGSLLGFNGLTMAVKVDDVAALRPGYDKLLAGVGRLLDEATAEQAAFGISGRGMRMRSMAADGTTVTYFVPVGVEAIMTPSVCLTDTHLLLSVFPRNLVDEVERPVERAASLAADARFAASGFDSETWVAGFADLGALSTVVYPMLQIGAQMLSSEMQQNSFDFDMGSFPQLAALAPYLGREHLHVGLSERGVTMARAGTLPTFDPTTAIGMIVPLAIFRIRTAAAFAPRAVAVAPIAARPVTKVPAEQTAAVGVELLQAMARKFHTKRGKVPTLADLHTADPEFRVPQGKFDADPWGTPYRIALGAAGGVEVVSAGPDRILDTADDVRAN